MNARNYLGRRPAFSSVVGDPVLDKLCQNIGDGAPATDQVLLAQTLTSVYSPDTVGQGVSTLASLGPSNAIRDFHRWVGACKDLGITPYNLKIELHHRRHLGKTKEMNVPVLPIHELLHAITCQGPATVLISLLGGVAAAPYIFWDRTVSLEWARQHPGVQAMKAANLLHVLIPLFFHQDGLEVFRDFEANMWMYQSGLTKGDTVETKFFLAMIWQEQMSSKAVRLYVNRCICKYIDYCVGVCETGVGPDKGFCEETFPSGSPQDKMRGKLMFNGWRFVFAGWKGDGKARKVENNFPRAWDCTYICSDCAATQPFKSAPLALMYTHFRLDAPWRDTPISHTLYMETDGSSPWALVRGWHKDLVYRDITHNLYIGVGLDVAGTYLYVFALVVLKFEDTVETVDEALHWLYISYSDWCRLHKIVPTPHVFSLRLLQKAKERQFPILSTRIKAAHVHNLLYFLAHASTFLDTGDDESKMRVVCINALAQFISILDGHGMWLPEDVAAQAHQAGTLFLVLWGDLAYAAIARGECLYKLRPKDHELQHQVDRIIVDFFNPRYHQCLNDEHMLGVYKKVLKGCARGYKNGCGANALILRYLSELYRTWLKRRHCVA